MCLKCFLVLIYIHSQGMRPLILVSVFCRTGIMLTGYSYRPLVPCLLLLVVLEFLNPKTFDSNNVRQLEIFSNSTLKAFSNPLPTFSTWIFSKIASTVVRKVIPRLRAIVFSKTFAFFNPTSTSNQFKYRPAYGYIPVKTVDIEILPYRSINYVLLTFFFGRVCVISQSRNPQSYQPLSHWFVAFTTIANLYSILKQWLYLILV